MKSFAVDTATAYTRVSSPLSNAMNHHHHSNLLAPPSRHQRSQHTPSSTSSSSSSRSQNLHLSGLPRFHPANYPSTPSNDTSVTSTPFSILDRPQSPLSPRQQHRQLNDTQRYIYGMNMSRHHHNHNSASPLFSPPPSTSSHGRRTPKPTSPRLHPLGSPGPVTPLELEQADGYMSVRIGSPSLHLSEDVEMELADALQEGENEMTVPLTTRMEGTVHRRDHVPRGRPLSRG